MPSLLTTARWLLRYPTANNVGSDVATGIEDLAQDIDAKLAPWSSGSLASRPPSTTGTPGKAGQVYKPTDAWGEDRDLGTSWQRMAPLPALVTTLPTTPVDGQEVYFQTSAMAALGVRFHLAYRAGSSSAYKWESVGGGGTISKYDGVGGPYSKSSSSGGFAGTSQLVAPAAGEYLVDASWEVKLQTTDAAKFIVVALAVDGTSGENKLSTITPAQGVSNARLTTGFSTVEYDMANGSVVRPIYYGPDNVTAVTVQNLRYSITPIRVG